ncbi:ferredoxin--NADP reductase [Gloeobacter kilaueensis]|nr:FAD-dependent oxidoreductase [Gloeobacter kilaueensis]
MNIQPDDYRAQVLCVVQMTPTIWSLHLGIDEESSGGSIPFRFLPGQAIWPRFEREGRTFTKIYSIASTPLIAPEVELCISRVGWASDYMCRLKPGDWVDLRGPYGMMTLEAVPERDVVYVAEGSGIAPIKSHIEWLFAQDNPPNVWLFYGGADPSEIAYHALWKDLAAHNLKFRYIPTVRSGEGEEFEPGSVEEAVAAFIRQPRALQVDICAVEDRVDTIKHALLQHGFEPAHLRTERFCSY